MSASSVVIAPASSRATFVPPNAIKDATVRPAAEAPSNATNALSVRIAQNAAKATAATGSDASRMSICTSRGRSHHPTARSAAIASGTLRPASRAKKNCWPAAPNASAATAIGCAPRAMLSAATADVIARVRRHRKTRGVPFRPMRLQDRERVSKAIRTLKGDRSLDSLVDRIYEITEGSVSLDRATLQRVATGRTRVTRAIDSPQDCVRLYFALMIIGCEEELTLAEIVGEGRTMLAGFVGEPLATLVFADLRRTLPKLTDLRTLREYLEEGLRIWLPK